jgi:hypothetical protein
MREPQIGDCFLGRLADKNVNDVREMTQAEFAQIREAMSVVRTFHRESQSYEHVQRDYEDLNHYTQGIRQLVSEYGTSPDLALDVEIEVNRRVMALLSSFKAFLDHTSHALSTRFGEDSAERKDFLRACSAEYDGAFAYRFAYKLRNYAQHRDLPIGYIELSGPSPHLGTSADISSECVRDQLVNSGFDWGSLRTELESQPPSWNIHGTIDQLMPCLARLRAVAVKSVSSTVKPAAQRLSSLAEEVGPDHQPVVVVIVDPTPNATRLRMNVLPHHHATQLLTEFG